MEAFKIPAAALQLLLALSSAFVPCKTQTAVITPLSYTARLGNVGIFHCAVTGSNIISWYINGLPSGYPSVRGRGIFTSRATSINITWIQSNLTIPATWENNGVSIDCAALLDSPQTTGISELATFHVKRPPLPPANLTLEVSQDQRYLILKWNPPPGNESTIPMYTVYVNVSLTGTVTHYNTSMRNYTIRNPCSDVTFKVTTWDDIGEGSTATFLAYSYNSTADTYGVQDLEISQDSLLNSICITCVFAQGTSAQGCYISLLENHDSVATNTTGLRIEREGESLNATGCIENLEGRLYHVAVYDVEADGTVDWHNRALVITAALNWTSDQLNTDVEETLIPNSNITLQKDNIVSAIAGGAVGGALLLVVTALILSCAIILRKVQCTQNSKQNNHDNTDDIEMKKNEIYGQLPQQQVVRNPAYNWWKPRHS